MAIVSTLRANEGDALPEVGWKRIGPEYGVPEALVTGSVTRCGPSRLPHADLELLLRHLQNLVRGHVVHVGH